MVSEKNENFAGGIHGSDAIIYIAGSSSGAGEDQEILVDYEAVIKSLEEAQHRKTERAVYLSPVRTDESEESKETGGKPVGMKIVVGDVEKLDEMVKYMRDSGKGPDFITIDGSEGGTGATYQELADSVGLPVMTALPIGDELLRQHDIRDRVKLIASGKLITPDKAAIALCTWGRISSISPGVL